MKAPSSERARHVTFPRWHSWLSRQRAPPPAAGAERYSRLDVAPADDGGAAHDSELLLPKQRNGSAC